MSAVTAPDGSSTARPHVARKDESFVDRAKKLFVGDELGPTPVTNVIVFTNVIVYAVMALYSRSSTALFSMPQETMQLFGANEALFTVGDSRFETLLTSAFLHFSLLHLGFNMVALRQVGPFVERSVGPGRFAPLYLVSGVLGSVTSALWGWHGDASRFSAGASGAICGVIGAAMVLGVRTQGIRGPLAVGMARWLGGIILLGFIARFDNAAHIGGAIGGAGVAALWQRGRTYSKTLERVILAAMTALAIASAVTVAWRDKYDPYVFANENARRHAANRYMILGQCVKARYALGRAEKLHPRSADTGDVERDLMLHCP
jgi:rhomboid protease GluP